MAISSKRVIFVNANTNYTLLSQLPKHKDKKKWHQIVQKTKLFYLCKNCSRQFIGDHALSYKGCHSCLIQKILTMLVRGIGITDIAVIENVSIKKVLSVFG